jgi:hypothetical protein
MRIKAMTSKVCTALPVDGIPEYTPGPKYPSNHRISKTIKIVESMRVLLLKVIPSFQSYRFHPIGASLRR